MLADDDDKSLGMPKPIEVARQRWYLLAKRCVYYISFLCSLFDSAYNTLPTDPTPSTTTATPPHTPSAKSLKWDSQSRKRGAALSTTKDGIDVQAALESLLNSGSVTYGNEERERELYLAPPQLRVPPSACDNPRITMHCAVQNGYKERKPEREPMRSPTREHYQQLHFHYRNSTPSGQGRIARFWERA